MPLLLSWKAESLSLRSNKLFLFKPTRCLRSCRVSLLLTAGDWIPHTRKSCSSLDVNFPLLEKSKIVTHIKMWTSLWGGLTEEADGILTYAFLKWIFKFYGYCKLPHSIPTRQPCFRGAFSWSQLLVLSHSIFCLFTKITNQGNPFIVLANTVLWEFEGSSQFLSISDSHSVPIWSAFLWETGNLMSLLSYLSLAHTHWYSSTINL